jgi:hypothetical protein
LDIAFTIIYLPIAHSLFYFTLSDVSAFHPASRMITVFQVRNTPVETVVTIYPGRRCTGTGFIFRNGRTAMIASLYKKERNSQYY